MQNDIVTVPLSVTHLWDAKQREALHYKPGAWGDQQISVAQGFHQQIRRDVLIGHICRLHEMVEALLIRALADQDRGPIDVEPDLRTLSRAVLPSHSLAAILPPEIHPTFDIFQDFLCAIPWESLDDEFLNCENGDCKNSHTPIAHDPQKPAGEYCPFCSEALVLRGGKLGINRHVGHVVYAAQPLAAPTTHGEPESQGDQFVMVIDPKGDLCRSDRDPHGTCERHVAQLEKLLKSAGFKVVICRESAATASAVLKCISDPQTAGLYYFGHGEFHERDGDGYLALHGAERLYASQIDEANPVIRFTFLNACEAGAASIDWDLEAPRRNLGQSFVAGDPNKVAIAPLWKIANVHAARSAVEFFEQVLQNHLPSQALQHARSESYRRYHEGQPDVSWMGYRLFGHANARVLISRAAPKVSPTPTPSGQVFGPDEKLNFAKFGFAVGDVMLRAAKRRNFQNRSQITTTDFFAGLLRRGALTRSAFLQQGVPPDSLYKTICDLPEPTMDESAADPSNGTSDTKNELTWIPRDQCEFQDSLIRLFNDAAGRSRQQAREDAGDTAVTISEADILFAYTADGTWATSQALGLPPADTIWGWIDQRLATKEVDANGGVSLAGLDRSACQIITTAQRLSSRCNVNPISTRLTLVAFLLQPKGFASRRCRELGYSADVICAFLITTVRGERPPPTSTLSPEVCGDFILGLAQQARDLVRGEVVDDQLLFQAFTSAVHPSFKYQLRELEPPLRIDLDKISLADTGRQSEESDDQPSLASRIHSTPAGDEGTPFGTNGNGVPVFADKSKAKEIYVALDKAAYDTIHAAGMWAFAQGLTKISTPHLFVALIGDGSGEPARMLKDRDVDIEMFKRKLLLCLQSEARPATEHPEFELSQSVAEAIQHAIRKARGDGRSRVTCLDLIRSITDNPQGIACVMLDRERVSRPYPWQL